MAGKTIVLLADGTGNSAAKLFKSNVWRLYKALDLSDPPRDGKQRQIAYYHDGVGTSSFKPLTILGGVFGVGLKRNVIEMYLFLCRNYEKGDRIYIYGFSRGAFTARVLASVIATQGILTCRTEEELHRYARDVYRRYRRRYKLPIIIRKDKTVPDGSRRRPSVSSIACATCATACIRVWRKARRKPQYDQIAAQNALVNQLDFIGVWDTVAAYGLPIDEMTRGIDDWVWPLSMPNLALHPKVSQARHALSLDDERDTFHPLLWDEVAEETMIEKGQVKKGRLKQVWFAGMHSNVGGGYADNSLSYGALEWMMDESEAAGLRFLPVEEREGPALRDDFGPLYNSRSGMGSYYRYQPRKIAARLEHPDPTTLMMQDPDRKGVGLLTSVTIYESVLHRVSAGDDAYAPIVLPDRFQVLKSDGTLVPHHLPLPSAAADGRPAVSRTEWVWNDVWRRRVNYFLTVVVSVGPRGTAADSCDMAAIGLRRPAMRARPDHHDSRRGFARIRAAVDPRLRDLARRLGCPRHWHPAAVGAKRRPEAPHSGRNARAVGVVAWAAQAREGGDLRRQISERPDRRNLSHSIAPRLSDVFPMAQMADFSRHLRRFRAGRRLRTGRDRDPHRCTARRDRVVRAAEQVLPTHVGTG